MLTAYSINQTVPAGSAVPLNSVVIEKGCAVKLASPSTIHLNKRGLYEVTVNMSSGTAASVAVTKDGVALPNTQMNGVDASRTTLVRVTENNSECCCSAPVSLQIVNPSENSATYTLVNVTVTKKC